MSSSSFSSSDDGDVRNQSYKGQGKPTFSEARKPLKPLVASYSSSMAKSSLKKITPVSHKNSKKLPGPSQPVDEDSSDEPTKVPLVHSRRDPTVRRPQATGGVAASSHAQQQPRQPPSWDDDSDSPSPSPHPEAAPAPNPSMRIPHWDRRAELTAAKSSAPAPPTESLRAPQDEFGNLKGPSGKVSTDSFSSSDKQSTQEGKRGGDAGQAPASSQDPPIAKDEAGSHEGEGAAGLRSPPDTKKDASRREGGIGGPSGGQEPRSGSEPPDSEFDSDIEYPERPESPGVVKPMPDGPQAARRPPQAGEPQQPTGADRAGRDTADRSRGAGPGSAPGSADEASDSASSHPRKRAPAPPGDPAPAPAPPPSPPRDASPPPGSTARSAASSAGRGAKAAAPREGGADPLNLRLPASAPGAPGVPGLRLDGPSPGRDSDGEDDLSDDGENFFAGDETEAPQLPAELADNWLPLSSRLDLPGPETFLWENFELAGLPEEAQRLGSKKAWKRHCSEADLRRALRDDPSDLVTLHRYAVFLYNVKKDIPLAERMFQRCLQLKEDYVEALIDYAGVCWLRWKMAPEGQKDMLDKHQAERMLRKAVKASTASPGKLQARAMSKLALFLDEALQQREEAGLYFRKAAMADPSTPDFAHNLAVHLEEAGESDQAAKWYKKAIQADMLYAPSLSNYARLLHRHFHDNKNALTYHQRAVRAAPNDPDICLNYALFQEEALRQYGAAQDFYNRATSMGSKDPSVYLAAAQFYIRRLRDQAKCAELHRTALKLDPHHIPCLLSFAQFLETECRDATAACALYQKALEVKGAGPELEAEALAAAGRFMQEKTGETGKAKEAIRRALEKRPKLATTLATCARFKLEVDKDQPAAVAVFTEALFRQDLTLDQRYDIHLSAAAFLEEECEDSSEDAGSHYREALKIRNDDPRAVAAYAGLLASFYGDPALADTYFRQAIRLDPRNAEALVGYARFLYEIKKQWTQAEHYFNKAAKADESSVDILLAFARFLQERADIQENRNRESDLRRALGLYRQAAERAQEDPEVHLAFAEFLIEQVPQHSESREGQRVTAPVMAEEQLVLAVEAAPKDPKYLVALADFLKERGRKPKEVDQLYQQALKLEADRAETLSSYALFLEESARDFGRAEQMHLRAITAEPREAAYLFNYAMFLEDKRKKYEEADEYYQRAADLDPDNAQIHRAYAELLAKRLRDPKKASIHLAKAASIEASAVIAEVQAGQLRAKAVGGDFRGLQQQSGGRHRVEESVGLVRGNTKEGWMPPTPVPCCLS